MTPSDWCGLATRTQVATGNSDVTIGRRPDSTDSIKYDDRGYGQNLVVQVPILQSLLV